MTKIITTVGTSLFSNFQRDEVKDRYGRDYASISINVPLRNIENDNPTAVGIYDDKYKHYIKSITENIEDYWLNDKYKENKQASAEIASILKIVEAEQDVEFEVHLLATDTLLSVLAGEMIAAWFARHPHHNIRQVLFQRTPATDFKAQKESDYVVKDLRIEASSRYESGFMHLIEVLDKLYDQSKQAGQHIIFNITGGYKAIIPIFTIYGQLRGIPLNYIYDDSNLQDPGLISIENLPFNFDWSVAELFADFITDQEIRSTLKDNDNILLALRNHKIIKNDSRQLTVLGVILEKYIDDRMFEGKTSFGFFAEYKVYEALIEDFQQIPKRGKEYWWDKNDESRYAESPMYEQDKEREVRIEIDLVSTNANGIQTWYEVKPNSKNGLRKAWDQFKERLRFLEKALQEPVEKFILVLYKFDFQTINRRQQIENLRTLFQDSPIDFEIWYFDVPINFDKEKINNKQFFERKINLQKL